MIAVDLECGLCIVRLPRMPPPTTTASPISDRKRKGRARGERAHQMDLAAESLRAIGGGLYA